MAKERLTLLRTVDEVVEALGGTNALAKWVERSPGAVSNWKKERWIPPNFYKAIQERLAELGMEADPKVFRQFEAA